jgi:hypothetical protein
MFVASPIAAITTSARLAAATARSRQSFSSASVAGGGDFFPIYSYLIVYRPETKPLQVVSILHGRWNLELILKERF